MRDSIWQVEIVTIVAAFIVAGIVGWFRLRGARRRRALADSAGLCLYCDSTDVQTEFAGIRCNTCGQLTSQALLDAKGPSDAELREILRPPEQE